MMSSLLYHDEGMPGKGTNNWPTTHARRQTTRRRDNGKGSPPKDLRNDTAAPGKTLLEAVTILMTLWVCGEQNRVPSNR